MQDTFAASQRLRRCFGVVSDIHSKVGYGCSAVQITAVFAFISQIGLHILSSQSRAALRAYLQGS